MTKNQNPEERNHILSSYLESDVLGFGEFDSYILREKNSSQSNSSAINKDDDHKLLELKQPQNKILMLLFDRQQQENILDTQLVDNNDASDKSKHEEFSKQNKKESVARFINAMASIKTGRDYISKS